MKIDNATDSFRAYTLQPCHFRGTMRFNNNILFFAVTVAVNRVRAQCAFMLENRQTIMKCIAMRMNFNGFPCPVFRYCRRRH